MGIEVIVTSRKFLSEFRNGSAFGSNLGEYTTNLTGSIMERIKLIQTVRVSWYSQADTSLGFYFPAPLQVQRFVGSFIDDGFAVGDTFDFNDALTGPYTTVFTGTVTAISSDGLNMFYTVTGGADQTGNNFAYPSCFRGTTVLKSLLYKWGVIENNEATNFINKATGKEQAYTFKDLTVSTTGVPSAGINVWEGGSITCSTGSVSGYYQTFTIEHIFINPYYAPGYEQDLIDETIPAEYDITASVKYVSQCEFRALYSNPNGGKIGIDDKNKGSVAWFGETFNGLTTPYSIASIGYEDTATVTPVTNLQKAYKTRVTVIVNGTFTMSSHDFGIYISKAPATVGNLADTFTQLFIEQDAIGLTDHSPYAGTGIITNYSAVTDGGGTFITIVFDIEFDAGQKARIEQGDYYILGIQIGTTGVANNISDKVTLLADYDAFVVNDDVEDLLVWRDCRFYKHTQIYPDDAAEATHDFKGWIEDGCLNNFNFDLDLSKDADLYALECQFIAYNQVTGEYWIISSYTFNTNQGVIAPIGGYGASRFNIQTKRDFNLPAGDQFNLIKLKTGTAVKNTSFLNYDAVVTWKTDWQKWIYNPNVDGIFYDIAELFNNFNQHSSNYIGGEWQLRFRYVATINNSGNPLLPNLTDYVFISARCIIYDYTKDFYSPLPKWTGVISTHTEDGSQALNGKILSNAKTLFKTVWTFDTAHYGTMSSAYLDFVGIHRIEPHYAPASNQIEEFSSLRFNLNQKLNGVSGKTSPPLLKVTVGVSTVTCECLIDFSKLDPKQNYKLSARLFAQDALVGKTWEQINVHWEDLTTSWMIL